ncbi:MAG: FG-GAP-like repeat-containing protein, partial [Tannerellaceae bacterium]|nr:FG-GAP-like repeat-containing protein [Tannerellaceae bacterium]
MKKYIITFLGILSTLVALQAQTYVPANFSGSLDISPMGGATYSIPLDLPAGIDRMIPQIGIAYSSQGRDGIMGKGFSVSGISSINRRQSTLFHEGAVNPISYSSLDRYMLDGTLLMASGTNEFMTETNTASRIKVYSPNTSSTYFTVEGKDGLVYEYGKTSDSKLFAQGSNKNQVAAWMLNKVSDRMGRYYTYTYEKSDAGGEIRLKQIDYTGTSSSTPFCAVKFNYKTRYYEINLNYVSGSKFKESKLLDNIQVYYGSTVLRTYAFNYEFFDNIYLLNRINVTGQHNEALKPIEFTWYKNDDFKQTEVKYDQTSYLNKAVISLGDFNGDGRMDFVATPQAGAGWTGWRLFLANADGNGFSYTSSGTIVEGLQRVIPGDFNGDGLTDFIAHRNTSGGTNVVYSAGTGTLFDNRLNITEEYRWDLNKNGENRGDGSVITLMTENDSSLIIKQEPENSIPGKVSSNPNLSPKGVSYDNYFVYYSTGNGFTGSTYGAIATTDRSHNIKIGDFNGDGAVDLFIYYTNKNIFQVDYDIIMSTYSTNGSYPSTYGANRVIASPSIESKARLVPLSHTTNGWIEYSDNWERVEVWDFNGDGIVDVLNLHDGGHHYYLNKGRGDISKVSTSTFPGKNHKINFGDFNGDGKIDVLLTGYNNMEWSEWQVHLSTGVGFEYFSFPKKFDTFSKEIFVCDLNGDGADDFFAVDNETPSSTFSPIKYYLANNNGKSFNGYSGTGVYGLNYWNFYPIDSRGDGRSGFITISRNGTWSGYQLYMPPADFTHLVNTIKDSYGNLTTLTYKRMADATVYTKTNPKGGSESIEEYDCLSFAAPFKLVSNVQTSDGIGGYREMAYQYEDAKVFKRGRGVLGFSKIIRTDVNNSVQTTITQEFSDTYYQPATKRIEDKKTSTGRVLSLTDYDNTLNSRAVSFSFMPTSISIKTYGPTNNNLIKSVTATYAYDAYNNVTKEVITAGNGDKTEITNTYTNNESSWLIGQLTNRSIQTTVGTAVQTNTTGFTYNANGSLATQTIEPSNASYKITTSYTYNSHGNLSKKTSVAGNETRNEEFVYLNAYQIDNYIDVYGNVTQYEYIPTNGLLLSEKSHGITNTYAYDGFGNLKSTSANTGETSAVNWYWTNASPANTVVRKEETWENGQVIKTWFDAPGREIQNERKNAAGTAVTVKRTYNTLGQLTSVTEPYFTSPQLAITYAYDTYGRMITESTPFGNITYAYASTSTGEQITVSDKTRGNAFTSIRTFDLAGKVTKITDSGGETITYTYGASGNPVKIQVGTAISEITYDLIGRRTRLKDPNAGTINYTYNAWGELLTKTDARNQTETYTYHPDSRINTYKRGTEVFTYQYPTEANKPKEQVVKVYNASGISTEYGYDDLGRVTNVTEKIDAGKSFLSEYKYNNKNQLEQFIYPGGRAVKYEYAYGDLKKITWVPTGTVVWEKLSENAKRQVLSAKAGNGMQTDYQYTAAGTPTSIKANGNTVMLNISYPGSQIDSRGNIGQRKDDYKGLSETFMYDNLNRLSSNLAGISYAANGNITSKSGVGSYTYNSSRPYAVSSLTDTPDGVMEENLTITYNSINRPVELALSSTHKYTLTYGTANQRIKSVYVKPGAATQTKYYVGPYEEILRGSSVQKNYYIYAEGGIAAVYTEGHSELSTGLYYFHNDHLGSPWLITNSA